MSILAWQDPAEIVEPDPQDPTVSDALEGFESQMVMKQEIAQAEEDLATKGLTPEEGPDMAAENDSDGEVDEEETPCSKVRGLADVLSTSGLTDFIPQKKEGELDAMLRVRKLSTAMRSFCGLVRSNEGIMSRAAVYGPKRKAGPYQMCEHALAEARMEFMCNASRQSRHSLWADYANRVAEAFDENDADVTEFKDGIKKLTHFRPNTFSTEDGKRACQLVVVRPFCSHSEDGPLRIGLVTCVWRGGKGKKEHLWPSGPLPVSSASRIHCRILVPQNEECKKKGHLLVASSRSPVVSLKADDGSVIFEVADFEHKYTDEYFQVRVRTATLKCMMHLLKSGVPFQVTKGKTVAVSETFLSEDDFARTAAGTKNIQRCLVAMARDYETHIRMLIDKKTERVKLAKNCEPKFTEIVARAPGYFKRYLKNHEHWKTLSKDSQALSCPDSI